MNINFITADWPAPDCIVAGTTSKQGGFSSAPYTGLNLASHVGDDLRIVRRNRQLLVSELNLPNEPRWLEQVHGIQVVNYAELESCISEQNCADAVISFQSNKICAVLTADCLPILVTNKSGTCVAAIHAGWRGLRDGIIEHTIKALQCPSQTLLVWIGPAIGKTVFEVDDSVRDDFINIDASSGNAYSPTRSGFWNMDLLFLAKQRLVNCGINSEAIYGGNYCSYLNENLFYSYRRNKITGRMASLIYIRTT